MASTHSDGADPKTGYTYHHQQCLSSSRFDHEQNPMKPGMSKRFISSVWTLVSGENWRRMRQVNRFGEKNGEAADPEGFYEGKQTKSEKTSSNCHSLAAPSRSLRTHPILRHAEFGWFLSARLMPVGHPLYRGRSHPSRLRSPASFQLVCTSIQSRYNDINRWDV